MILSEISIKRPVLAIVLNLLLVVFGIVCFYKLPLREYPNIDPPIVSIDTNYPGASASIVESRITKIIEDRIAGVQGIRSISSSSEDGRSRITVEFNVNQDLDAVTNDIRDRVSGVLDDLPLEVRAPEIQKASADDDVIIWFNFSSDKMSVMELTDYADRYLVDQFSALDGVARVRIGGAKEKALRIWIDRKALAAHSLTVNDIEERLRSENIELPAGQLQSEQRDFTLRIKRPFATAEEFDELVLAKGDDGYLIRLKDVARVEVAPVEERGFFRGNGVPMVGIGIIKQSTANTLEVAQLAKNKRDEINQQLPAGMILSNSYDSSVFIESAVAEVYKTLFIAIILVTFVIYLFLGSWHLTLIPAITVPVSLIATYIVLLGFGFTINLLTLLALVLSIGLVIDDAIVVLENVHRRMENGEHRLIAALRGTQQVEFAVIATTLVLIAVFIPITFLEGDVGRLFSEFAIAMAAAVSFSSFVALTLCSMMSSKMLSKNEKKTFIAQKMDQSINFIRDKYIEQLKYFLKKPILIIILFIAILGSCLFLFAKVPSEFAPSEDRGVIFMMISGPEGVSETYMAEHMNEIEKRLMKYVDTGEFSRLLMRAPRTLSNSASFHNGMGIIVLNDWGSGRKPIWHYVDEIQKLTKDLVGVRVFPIVRQGLVRGTSKPVQFVLGASTYEELVQMRDALLNKAKENTKLLGIDYDYKETKPQINVEIDRNRAGDLGVPLININRSLESMMGTRRVTTYIEDGEEYDVMIESKKEQKKSLTDISNIYVRSPLTQELIPLSNLVSLSESADAEILNRYNRLRSITIDASLANGYTLGEALDYLNDIVATEIEGNVAINYKGESLNYIESETSVFYIFLLSLMIVFLVLAGQFESFIHPLVIMFTVPLALFGALLGLWLFGQSLNIYSQIGIIMLIGLAAKNGILIVEFINQLRDEGVNFYDAIIEASIIRFRPILMTSVTTVVGAIPLIMSFGAGAETRYVLGLVIFFGVAIMTFFTLFVIPIIYQYLAKNTGSPKAITREIDSLLKKGDEQ